MSAVWSQTAGHGVNMLDPKVEDVDFKEICFHLAGLNRWSGGASSPVSVAFHELICFEEAKADPDPMIAAYMLIHDCHEYVIGEIPRPAALALAEIAEGLQGGIGRYLVQDSLLALKERHDHAILTAAGLRTPTTEQRKRIKHYDNISLVTEARDFGLKMHESWGPILQSVPSKRVYCEGYFGPTPAIVAAKLYARMELAFPALFARKMGLSMRGLADERLAV